MEEGYTYGYNNARDAVSLTPRKHIEPLLLPDQLMNLPRLSGYLKFPDGFPAAPVRLVPTARPRVAEGFIRRAADVGADSCQGPTNDEPVSARRRSGSEEHRSSNDDGTGPPVGSSQGELPLVDPSSATLAEEREQPRAGAADTMDAAGRGEEFAPVKGSGKAEDQRADAVAQAASRPTVPLCLLIRSDAGEGEHSVEGELAGQSRATPQATSGPSQTAVERGRSAEQRAAAEERRLMLEDGARDEDRGTRDGPELGDIDFDI